MTLKIRRAAVLGAGVMGAQIAAHLAAAGIRTHLLDLESEEPPKDPKIAAQIGKNFRSARSLMAIEGLKSLKPSPLVSPSVLAQIIPGNFADDMSVLADVDWVIEAVVERLDIKKSIHKKIMEHARPHIPVTTNTSGIPLSDMVADLPVHYQRRFFATHFFNPPRYMRLIEVIAHEETDDQLFSEMNTFLSERLGKGVVLASDTINFIANRVGVLAIQSVLKHMSELKLSIATVDMLTGPLIGRPKSATMRTMDVVGLDTFGHVASNVFSHIKKDPYHSLFAMPPWIKHLVDQGMLGQKSAKGGCYQKSKNKNGETVFLTFDPESLTHKEIEADQVSWFADAQKIKSLPERLRFIFGQKDKYADFLWRIHRDVFSYAALLLEEIAHGAPKSLDDAMRWGFNWEMGPFECWQAAGVSEILNRIKQDGSPLPSWLDAKTVFYKPLPSEAAWRTSDDRQQLRVPKLKFEKVVRAPHEFGLPLSPSGSDPRSILGNKSASLVDIGDGVACLVFHSKMNTLNDEIIEIAQKSIAKVSEGFAGLVIANDGENFSAGAYLGSVVEAIEGQNFDAIERMVRNFQTATQLIKFAPFPVVAAPHGLTLGGGCEIVLHATRVIPANDTFAGLVEVGVGLVPAGGGTKELALRAYDYAAAGDGVDPMAFLKRAFMLMGMARVSTSGLEAIEMGLFPAHARVCMSRDHQVLRSKQSVLHEVAQGYSAPVPRSDLIVPGDPAIQTFRMMLYNMSEGRQISAYDAHLATQIATILCGGEVDAGSKVSEQHFLDLERRAFVDLCRRRETKDRIVHMLKTGKPLRN